MMHTIHDITVDFPTGVNPQTFTAGIDRIVQGYPGARCRAIVQPGGTNTPDRLLVQVPARSTDDATRTVNAIVANHLVLESDPALGEQEDRRQALL